LKIENPKAKLPFVFINIAMTADGKIATENRAVSSFGSRRDQEHLLELRATADAVMTGARTADLNDVTLGPGPAKYRRARLRRGLAEYNLRIIVSGSGSVDPQAAVFKHKFSPMIILTTARAGKRRLDALREVADEVKICGQKEIDFRRALQWLRQKWKVRRLLCEGGGEVNAALFKAGLVNELYLTVTPYVVAGRSAPTLADGAGATSLSLATKLKLKSASGHGKELFLVYRRPVTKEARG
jgi:2,5-diamino-6-(ribosylamino)-4(3H)-pyrimidinone 5'-phosphate reductase